MRGLAALSLRSKIVGLTLAAALPCLLLAVVVSAQRVQDLRHERQTAALELARLAASLVDALIESTEAMVVGLGKHPVVVKGEPAATEELFLRLLPTMQLHDNLIAVAADGTVFANARGLPPGGMNIASTELFREVIGTAQPVVTGVFPALLDGRPTVMFAAPIVDDSGRVLGMVGAHFNLATMHQVFARLNREPGTTLISVNDVSGGIISRNIEPRQFVGKSIGGSPLMNLVNEQPEGIGEIAFPDGITRVLGFARTSAAPWRVIVGAPTEALYAQLRAWLLAYAGSILLVTVLTPLLAAMLAGRLTRALDGLVARSRAIAAGRPSGRSDPLERHELQTLSYAFDEMERALAVSRSELEKKVRELERANGELQALDQAKSTFVATISHELRTPLTYLVGFSQLLRDRAESVDEAREMGRHMADAARRLTRVVDDIIHFSELQAIGVRVEPEAVALERVVRECVEQLGMETHRVRVALPHDLPGVRADATRIGQVVSNLLSNAMKFSPAGSEIVVEATADATRVRLTVSDRGIGVAGDEAAELFAPFHRGEQARRRQIAGFGLGLAICRRIVELHGGEIGMEPRDGGGSTFWFWLPAGPAGQNGHVTAGRAAMASVEG